jgi:hypothetical protein
MSFLWGAFWHLLKRRDSNTDESGIKRRTGDCQGALLVQLTRSLEDSFPEEADVRDSRRVALAAKALCHDFQQTTLIPKESGPLLGGFDHGFS